MAEDKEKESRYGDDKFEKLADIANKIRIHAIRCASNSGNSGNPSSASSCSEILSVLFFDVMVYDNTEPTSAAADRLILSKGQAYAALYGAWLEAGLYRESELSRLGRVPSSASLIAISHQAKMREIDAATGSIGLSLSMAAGMAYVGKFVDKAPYKVYCVIGDAEAQEGGVFEALAFATFYKLDNLIPIFDVNRTSHNGSSTTAEYSMSAYRTRVESFGWRVLIIDGNDVEALSGALREAKKATSPTCILAKTSKGRGVPDVDDMQNWHGKILPVNHATPAIDLFQKLLASPSATVTGTHGLLSKKPNWTVDPPVDYTELRLSEPPAYKIGEKVATQSAYGIALVKLGSTSNRIMVFDAEVKSSTMTLGFKNKFPNQFVECFIAEQNMVGAATGAACRNRAVVFASTFACFLSRAYDQLRMGCISMTNLNLCGSHAGVSIGADGPSQMALEDLAMFRSLPSCTVFYPSDAVSTERAVELAARTKGMTYIRTTRGVAPVIYENDEPFEVGKAKIVRQGSAPRCVIIGAGVTLIEALKAAEWLAEYHFEVTIIDPFTIKPIDTKTISEAVNSAQGNLVIVEDHYPQGGIGEAVLTSLLIDRSSSPVQLNQVRHLAIRELPKCGPEISVLARCQIDADAIVAAARDAAGY